MRSKLERILPVALMLVFAMSRAPGLLPLNFSAVYALVFCAGVYFPKRLAWWLPLATMAATDLLLNWYYHAKFGTPMFSPELAGNYLCYAAFVWLGRKFTPKASFASLVGGGVLCAILFYLVSNTVSWFLNPFQNPEYVKTFTGWLIALTKGTTGYMSTWEFFRNTLASGGLFTGLFAGAMKWLESLEPAEETEPEEDEAEAGEQPKEEPA